MTDRRYECPCCGFRTLTDSNNYEVCPVCFWEDDPVQKEDPHYNGGANSLSLEQARRNYVEISASQGEFLKKVRPPRPEEMPVSRLFTGLDRDRQEQIRRQVKVHILAVVRGVLSDRIPAVDGCNWIATLALRLHAPGENQFQFFEGVASELDDFPQGSARQHWEPEALVRKDRELAHYAESIHDKVLSACRELEPVLQAELTEHDSSAVQQKNL